MKISTRIAAALTALALALPLASCHGTGHRDAFAVPDEFDLTKTHEITFWAKNDSNNTQKKIYQKAIEDFEALYPNVKVTMRSYTDYGKIYNDVITNISTSTTPNVCVTYPDHVATYITGSNVVVPLDSLINDPDYGMGGAKLAFTSPAPDRIVPQYLEEGRVEGQIYDLPFMRSTEACYFNRDYVRALGFEIPEVLTWDFIWEVSEAAMAKNSDGTFVLNNQKTMIPFIYKSTDNMMIQLLKQKGADYSDALGNVLLFNEDTRGFLETVYAHAKTGAFSTFKISSYPGNFLNAGQCVFAVDSTAGATWMGKLAPHLDISADKVADFDLGVAPVPQLDPANPKMISQGPSLCVFNKEDPQEVLASWLFCQFLLTDGVQIPYSQTEGYAPVTLSAREDPGYADYLSRGGEDNELYYDIKLKATRLVLDNSDKTFITPVFNGSASLRDAAGQLIENVAKSARRNEKIGEGYYEKLFADVRSLYRLDQISRSGSSSDLGALPGGAIALICGLGAVWIGIAAYFAAGKIRAKNSRKS